MNGSQKYDLQYQKITKSETELASSTAVCFGSHVSYGSLPPRLAIPKLIRIMLNNTTLTGCPAVAETLKPKILTYYNRYQKHGSIHIYSHLKRNILLINVGSFRLLVHSQFTCWL